MFVNYDHRVFGLLVEWFGLATTKPGRFYIIELNNTNVRLEDVQSTEMNITATTTMAKT